MALQIEHIEGQLTWPEGGKVGSLEEVTAQLRQERQQP